jgi:hypothetical protein
MSLKLLQRGSGGSNVSMKINIPVNFFMLNNSPDLKATHLKIPRNIVCDHVSSQNENVFLYV